MQSTNYLDHPAEEALERFVLCQSDEAELEIVETHILACEPCVARLQALEIEVATTKLALRNLQSELTGKAGAKQRSLRKNWFSMPALTMPVFSMTGAVAALVVGVFVLPQAFHRNAPTTDITLSAYRGLESTSVPAGRPLRLHLNASDLAEGPVSVQVVNARGLELWKGAAVVQHDRVNLNVPGISGLGPHFLRLYRDTSGGAEGELLREFAFQVQ